MRTDRKIILESLTNNLDKFLDKLSDIECLDLSNYLSYNFLKKQPTEIQKEFIEEFFTLDKWLNFYQKCKRIEMGNKPAFEEKEIEELCVLYANINYDIAVWEILTFLEKQLGYSKVSNVATEIRKEFVNKRCRDKQNKHQLNYPNSTLQLKLLKRIDFTESQNIIL